MRKNIKTKGLVCVLIAGLIVSQFGFVTAFAAEGIPAAKENYGGDITFPDVEGHYIDIQWLAKNGVISGYPDGTFRPNNNVTRAEFTKMLCVALGLESEANARNGKVVFSDVSSGNWASGYIALMAEMGVVNGVGNGNFNPGGNVTYNEIGKMLTLSMGYSESEAVSRGGWPAGYVSLAKEAGIASEDSLSPPKIGNWNSAASRRFSARMLYNAALIVPPVIFSVYDYKSKVAGTSDSVYATFIPKTCTIYYTTDGTKPTKESAPYNRISIKTSTTVSYVMINRAGKEGPVVVYTYNVPKGDELQAKLAVIIAEIIKPGMSDTEKAKAIFDWCKGNKGIGKGIATLFNLTSFPAGGDCAAVKSAFLYLAGASGLESSWVGGKTPRGEDHYWNMAKIDGYWYMFDVNFGKFGVTADNMEKMGYTTYFDYIRDEYGPLGATNLEEPASVVIPKDPVEELAAEGYIELPFGVTDHVSSDFNGMQKDAVVSSLKALGFTNVILQGAVSSKPVDTVAGVVISNLKETNGKTYVKPDSKIEVLYVLYDHGGKPPAQTQTPPVQETPSQPVQETPSQEAPPQPVQETPVPETPAEETPKSDLGSLEAEGYVALPSVPRGTDNLVATLHSLGFTTQIVEEANHNTAKGYAFRLVVTGGGSITSGGKLWAKPGCEVVVYVAM
ncbi:MAG: S-layer homology domain-containing protein [Clostridiales Family XIII bacterium]|jgi:hypothetical protein|nr:S-layer homology domain-containing protein [Clostridiales Family XIII bacterium]